MAYFMDGPFLTSQLEIPLKDTKCLKLQTNQISANLGNACVLRAKCEYQGKVESYRRPLFFHFCNQSNPYCYMKKKSYPMGPKHTQQRRISEFKRLPDFIKYHHCLLWHQIGNSSIIFYSLLQGSLWNIERWNSFTWS